MARSAPATPLSLPRFLRDLAVVLGGIGLVLAATLRWVAMPCTIDGPSMEPTLLPGDRVLVELWSLRGRAPRTGEIVLIAGLPGSSLVKRVARMPPDGESVPPAVLPRADVLEPVYWVLGDNPAGSSDSRSFGAVPRRFVRGRVLWRYWPPARAGAIE